MGSDGEVNPLDLAARLRLPIARLARQLRRTAETPLTPTQTSVLVTVSVHGPITLGELAAREQVASPTITKVVNTLHERGFLSKVTDPEDRRFVLVEVTTAAATMLAENRERKNAWLAERLSHLDAEDLRRLDDAADVIERLAEPQLPK